MEALRYTLFCDWAIVRAIFWAALIFRSLRYPGFVLIAWPISLADSASPSAAQPSAASPGWPSLPGTEPFGHLAGQPVWIQQHLCIPCQNSALLWKHHQG